MATSVYFSKGTNTEQYLYEDLIIEQLKVFGHDVYYLPRTLVKEDDLLGEDTLSSFNDAYMIEMYMEEVEGYSGDKELIAKFGIEMREEVVFVVARRRWEKLISLDSNLIVATRPNEGDLIYFPRIQKMFEINFVDHDDPFYQVDNLPVYKLSCSTFEYSHEKFDTDIDVIDDIETKYSGDILFWQFLGEQSSTYEDSIGLEDGSGLIASEDGTLGAPGLIVAETETGFDALLTEASDSNNSFYIINEEHTLKDPEADNVLIEELSTTNSDAVLDFTEINPFGEPTEIY